MRTKLFLLFFLGMFVFSSFDAKAVSFYLGTGLGDSKGRVEHLHLDNKHAFVFSIGSHFNIPLFPVRTEIEYFNAKMQKDEIGDAKLIGYSLNTYVNIPLLPILVPYVGIGLGTMKEKFKSGVADFSGQSNWNFVPQYMVGIDLDLPTVPVAGSMEYRYIERKFDFDVADLKSKYHIFMFKARVKF